MRTRSRSFLLAALAVVLVAGGAGAALSRTLLVPALHGAHATPAAAAADRTPHVRRHHRRPATTATAPAPAAATPVAAAPAPKPEKKHEKPGHAHAKGTDDGEVVITPVDDAQDDATQDDPGITGASEGDATPVAAGGDGTATQPQQAASTTPAPAPAPTATDPSAAPPAP